jgi:hypothetical protein
LLSVLFLAAPGNHDDANRDLEANPDGLAGFNSSRTHFEEQQMRLMSEIFERNKVDIVFTGHVHNYQRTFHCTSSQARGTSEQSKENGSSTGSSTVSAGRSRMA